MDTVMNEIHPSPILINCSIKINLNIKLINIILIAFCVFQPIFMYSTLLDVTTLKTLRDLHKS
jgi:hypothetical protein